MTINPLQHKPSFDDVPEIFSALGVNVLDVSNIPDVLKSLHCTNRNGSTRWLQVFDTTGGATTPLLYQWPVPGGGQILLGTDFFTNVGWKFLNGITVGVSTTSGSYVAATAGDHDIAGSRGPT